MAAASPSTTSARPARPEVDGDSWQPDPEKVSGPRGRDFARLTELQARLKSLCASLLHFTRRDFAALAEAAPEHAAECEALRGEELADSIRSLEPRLVRLAERIQTSEQLRIVFLGPVKAGKSTLISILLTAQLGKGCYEMLLPVDYKAATNCIWKVESCEGHTAEVRLEGDLLQQWTSDHADATALERTRREIADFLQDNLGRHARPENRREVLVRLPLSMLDPFGCHYCLVDTPGYTESEEYEALVKKYLQDHSHIACMVCPMTEGTAIPQATRNMLQRSFSKTLWVLTRYDDILNRSPPKRGQDRREAADDVVRRFTEEIQEVDAHARVFKQAAQVLMPDEKFTNVAQMLLSVEDAVSWLEDIRACVKESFLLIQQEQLILSSQSRQCVDIASELLQEYTRLRDGTQGQLAASDHYVHELQIGAEDASKCLGREIRQEIENMKTSELDRLCTEAAAEVRKEKSQFLVQQAYFDALLAALVPKMERELQGRIDAAMERARQRLLDVVLKLVRDAGVACGERSESASPLSMAAPDSQHLRARYPVESLATLTIMSGGVGAAALSEGGAVLLSTLGLRVGAAAVWGCVGVAVVSFATLGVAVKKLTEWHPVWSYQSVEKSAVETMRSANQWGILAEASCCRAEAHLLSFAAHFRYAFSKAILSKGTPRDVLVAIFPDLPLFEVIHAGLEKTCSDIRQFVDAQDLAARALDDVVACEEAAKQKSWDRVIDATSVYVGSNARTDSVPGKDLARLYQLRCEALSKANKLGEARHSASIFRRAFPQLSLPLVYGTAAGIVFDFRAGTLDTISQRDALQQVHDLATRLGREVGGREVPRLVEIWLLAVGASFLGEAGRGRRGRGRGRGRGEGLSPLLREAIGGFLAVQMKGRPSWQAICDQKLQVKRAGAAAAGIELTSDVLRFFRTGAMCEAGPPQGLQDDQELYQDYQEIQRCYQEECNTYADGVVNSIHLMLAALPPSQVDVEDVGSLVAETVLAQVSQQLTRPTPMPREVEVRIRSNLCPGDTGFVDDLADEWVRVLGTSLRGCQLHDPDAYRVGAE